MTDRLVLRRGRLEDAIFLHRVFASPQAMQYWSTSPHISLAETQEWLTSMVDAPPGASNDFIIEFDGQPIGKAGCWRLPEIGIIIHPEHWGRGLAREALSAAINDTFSRFPLPTIKADVDPRNLASLRLLEGLGFERTGQAERTWFVNDAWADSLYLELKREVWKSRDHGPMEN
ncbi:MAG: GNAT family N-acetyltransferase [Allosphingosinicella sp.]